jgi:hypothetical protein
VTRWCCIHHGPVQDEDAQIVGAVETGSGPGMPTYACIGCIRAHGIVPLTAARRDVPHGEPV